MTTHSPQPAFWQSARNAVLLIGMFFIPLAIGTFAGLPELSALAVGMLFGTSISFEAKRQETRVAIRTALLITAVAGGWAHSRQLIAVTCGMFVSFEFARWLWGTNRARS